MMPELPQLYRYILTGMFGFFTIGMLIGRVRPCRALCCSSHCCLSCSSRCAAHHPVGIADWWSRNTAFVLLTLLGGVPFFGVSEESFQKQALFFMTGLLLNFVAAAFFITDAAGKQVGAAMWYPQLALQVVLVAINAYLVFGGDDAPAADDAKITDSYGAVTGAAPKRGRHCANERNLS